MPKQQALFERQHRSLPAGMRYQPELLTADEEAELVQKLAALPFKEFEFQGFVGKRRVVSYGWRYDFNGGGLHKADDIPDFLLPVRAKAAAFAEIPALELPHVLLTEYPPDATIGWHKDRGVFGRVVGISLLAPCTFRLRRTPMKNGSAPRSSRNRAPPICSTARRAPNGSTASLPWRRCATPSPFER